MSDRGAAMSANDTPRCPLCGGTAGRLPGGRHNLCAARAELGSPTPNLGTRCPTCNGSGTTGKGGVPVFFASGPAAIARSIAAQFPSCLACRGSGALIARVRQ